MTQPPSPRYSSAGSYSTWITGPGINDRAAYLGIGGELPESSVRMAQVRLHEYIAALPSKSWLGKRVVDVLRHEHLIYNRALDLAERLWGSLIDFDEQIRVVHYRALVPSTRLINDGRLITLTEACWRKLIGILEYTGALMIHQNPAYIRSPSYETDRFAALIFIKMTEDKTIRHKLIRCLNLIDSISRSIRG